MVCEAERRVGHGAPEPAVADGVGPARHIASD
jgi:hypothetical protein